MVHIKKNYLFSVLNKFHGCKYTGLASKNVYVCCSFVRT